MNANESSGDDHVYQTPRTSAPNISKRIAIVVTVAAGIAVGIFHLFIAGRSLWLFRNDEPFSSWVIILAGPSSTLPAILVAVYWRRFGTLWLIGGGLVSLAAVLIHEATTGQPIVVMALSMLRYLMMFSAPMVAIGATMLWLQGRWSRGAPSSGQTTRP